MSHTKSSAPFLVDAVVIVVRGLICGCDGPTAIHRWASNRQEWLQGVLELPTGIPSRDCVRRPLIASQPQAFQSCFQRWVSEALQINSESDRLVAIDGKTRPRYHVKAKGRCFSMR